MSAEERLLELVNELRDNRDYYANLFLFNIAFFTIYSIFTELLEKKIIGPLFDISLALGVIVFLPMLISLPLIFIIGIICTYKTYKITKIGGLNLHIKKEDAKKKLIEDGKYYAKVMSCFLVLSLAASTYSGNFILVTSQFFLILLGVIYSYKIVKFFSYEYLSNGPVKDRHIMIMFSIILIIGFLAFSSDDSNSITNGDPTTSISVQMYNNDDARHPVHVYLNGERVYGEWVEAGEMVWPTICFHRCPDGDYTVAIDWGGDAEYECMFYVQISYEGDRETVACNYHR